jgi:SAP domain-containing ribonucleoprotein
LSDFISSEEKNILQTNNSEGDDTDDVLDLPEEDVLGISTSEEKNLTLPKKELSPRKIIIPKVTTTTPSPQKFSAEKSPVQTQAVTDQKVDSSEEKSAEPKSKHTKIVVTSPDSDEAMKILERAKRFQTPLSDTARKDLRAERFKSAQGKTQAMIKPLLHISPPSTTTAAVDDDVLKRRQERFGIITKEIESKTGGTGKLAERANRFGLNKNGVDKSSTKTSLDSVKPEDKEKILKRKERFGDVVGEQPTSKKMFRSKRFAQT